MPKVISQPSPVYFKALVFVVGAFCLLVFATVTRDKWWPSEVRQPAANGHAEHDSDEAAHDHGAEEETHNHDHAGHDEANSIELSANGLNNIGFEPFEVQASDYEKKLTLPAMVVERPGRSLIHISAPITGIVTEIFAVQGQAVEEGSPLFVIRLTNEDVVAAQSELLRTSESLNVVNQELARLNALAEGVVAGKRILEQQYEKQKLEASFLAEQQALVVHGLSKEQVKNILETRQLLRTIKITAPDHTHDDGCVGEHLFHVQSLPVAQGQQVATGQELAVLADHCELYVEGRAFEDDAAQIRVAAKEGRNVEGILLGSGKQKEVVSGLKLMYLADRVDPQSRAFHFYLRLPNEITLDQQPFPNRRFIEWRFKPGQRMELRVPVEQWKGQLVLPVDAVVSEGAEAYIYRQNGDHFDRVPVQIEFRDRDAIVIANNGSLFPGDIIAGKGAYQMHLALKNKAGGGVDPHAGHNH
jgi:multidrug efflux pump subunit AcrA (membrane-fusion protein)